MDSSVPRPNNRDLVTGAHPFPSDVIRPNMLDGRVLRPPSYEATLESINLSAAQAMDDVVVVHDGEFVGFAAPSLFRATQGLDASAKTASWKTDSQLFVSNQTVHAYLQEHARTGNARESSVEKGFAAAAKTLAATYTLAYIQHTPMEPRAGVAEWQDDKLTVWAGVDNPPHVHLVDRGCAWRTLARRDTCPGCFWSAPQISLDNVAADLAHIERLEDSRVRLLVHPRGSLWPSPDVEAHAGLAFPQANRAAISGPM